MTDSPSQTRNARIGIRLFLLYAGFYLAYVLVNAFAAQWSDWEIVAGLNLAIVWGFALIGLAFVLALLYGYLCTDDDESHATDKTPGGEVRR